MMAAFSAKKRKSGWDVWQDLKPAYGGYAKFYKQILNDRTNCLGIRGRLICYSHFTRIGKKHQKQGSDYSKHDNRGNGGKINHEA